MPNIMKSLIELGGDIASTQVANSAVADIFAPLTSTGVAGASVAYVAPELTAEQSLVRDFPNSPCNAPLGNNNLANLKHLTREEEGKKFTAPLGTWSSVKSKWNLVLGKIREIEEAYTLSQNEQDILTNIKGRWADTEALLDTDPALPNFNNPDITDYLQKQADDKNDLSALKAIKSGRYNNLELELYKFVAQGGQKENFHAKFNNFIEEYQKYIDEPAEFPRFDDLYQHPDTLKYLSWIRTVSFTPAEIKALHCQESGDFTIISIAGIETKIKGIKDEKTKNRGGFIGIAQMDNNSIIGAKNWLQKRYRDLNSSYSNDVLKAISNFRAENVQQCIWLSIGYLGYLADQALYPKLPDPFPSCAEYKKIIFSAYNYGQKNVIDACNACVTGKNYNWDDMLPKLLDIARKKSDNDKVNEIAKYVPRIIERLNRN